MESLTAAVFYAGLAGAAIPVGAAFSRWESFAPRWAERELRHSIIAFGGGVLVAAVALVLVPEGLKYAPDTAALPAFAAGGFAFFLLDRRLARKGGSLAQFMAMLLDFIPEAIALGAAFALNESAGPLLAVLIAVQNVPEAFNADREIRATTQSRHTLLLLTATALLGPCAALFGHVVLAERTIILGVLMMFAAGGILYLTFEDIAPQAKLERHWGPALGAVGGFLVALIGQALLL